MGLSFPNFLSKRPYIKLSLEEIEGYIADAARRRDTLLLFGAFLELCYRVTSAARRDKAKQNIVALLEEFENISLSPNARRSEIEQARNRYLGEISKAQEKQQQARLAKEAEAKRAAAEKARQEEEAEKARLAKEAEAKRAAEKRRVRRRKPKRRD